MTERQTFLYLSKWRRLLCETWKLQHSHNTFPDNTLVTWAGQKYALFAPVMQFFYAVHKKVGQSQISISMTLSGALV